MKPHTDHDRRKQEARIGCICLLISLSIFWGTIAAFILAILKLR